MQHYGLRWAYSSRGRLMALRCWLGRINLRSAAPRFGDRVGLSETEKKAGLRTSNRAEDCASDNLHRRSPFFWGLACCLKTYRL
jgi:hypothetical protein